MISDLDGMIKKLVEIYGKNAVRKALESSQDPNQRSPRLLGPLDIPVRIFNSVNRASPNFFSTKHTKEEYERVWLNTAIEIVGAGYPECIKRFGLRNFGRKSFIVLKESLIKKGHVAE